MGMENKTEEKKMKRNRIDSVYHFDEKELIFIGFSSSSSSFLVRMQVAAHWYCCYCCFFSISGQPHSGSVTHFFGFKTKGHGQKKPSNIFFFLLLDYFYFRFENLKEKNIIFFDAREEQERARDLHKYIGTHKIGTQNTYK